MSDALERLKNRARPTVPQRDASLTPSSPNVPKSRYPDIQISESRDIEVPVSPGVGQEQGIQTRQSTVRFEVELGDRLQATCRQHRICREALLEALFEYYEARADSLQEVVTAAKVKNAQRRRGANRKRAQSMIARFGELP